MGHRGPLAGAYRHHHCCKPWPAWQGPAGKCTLVALTVTCTLMLLLSKCIVRRPIILWTSGTFGAWLIKLAAADQELLGVFKPSAADQQHTVWLVLSM